MKIVFFFTGLEKPAGTERVMTTIVNALSKTHKIKIYLLNNKKPFFELNKDVEIVPLANNGENTFKIFFPAVINFFKSYRKDKPDLIVVVDVVPLLFILKVKWFLKCPLWVWEHFNFDVKGRGRINRVFIRKTILPILTDKIITLTKRDRETYIKKTGLGEDKVIAIPNPTELNKIKSGDYSNKTALAVGRLSDQKGFDRLLEIWSKLPVGYSDWKLIIAGEGSNKDILNKKIKELGLLTVLIVDPVRDICELFDQSSIYLMTSRYEGLPMILLEAKAYGLPIISYDCPTGPSEIIINYVDGYLVEDGNENVFFEKLIALMEDEQLRKEMGERAREDKRFGVNDIIAIWNSILK